MNYVRQKCTLTAANMTESMKSCGEIVEAEVVEVEEIVEEPVAVGAADSEETAE